MPDPREETSSDRGNADAFLTVEETAAMLRIADELVRRHIREGRLKAYKAGKFWRIPKREILRFLKMEHAEGAPRLMQPSPSFPAHSERQVEFESPPVSVREERISSPVRVAEASRVYRNELGAPSLDDEYLNLDAYIAKFEAMTSTYSTKVLRSDDPFWEVTIASRTEKGPVIRKYIAAPGATEQVAVVEDLVDDGGSVAIAYFKNYRSFRMFVQEVLQRELMRLRELATE